MSGPRLRESSARRIAGALSLSVSISLATIPNVARAADGEETRALAADLFDAGVKKMDRGRCTAAKVDTILCQGARDDFRRAFALYPNGLGALRNLAQVEKGLNLLASAARDFRELARRAPLDPNPVRRPWADLARHEAEALEQRVPRLKLDVATPAPPEMTITLDGAAVPEPAWGAEITVDPGAHALRAEAPGRTPLDVSFVIAEQETKPLSIALPALPGRAGEAEQTRGGDGAKASGHGTSSRIAPAIVAGVGLTTVGLGLALGAVAIKKHSDACGGTNYCEPIGLESGRSVARASTIVTSVGGGVLAIGLLWYVLTPSGSGSGTKSAGMLIPFASPSGGGVLATRQF